MTLLSPTSVCETNLVPNQALTQSSLPTCEELVVEKLLLEVVTGNEAALAPAAPAAAPVAP
jgi:hypothetical protein